MGFIFHNINLFRIQSDCLHTLAVAYPPEFYMITFKIIGSLTWISSPLHILLFSLVFYSRNLVINDVWLSFLVSFCNNIRIRTSASFSATSHPRVCPYPELCEDSPLQQLHCGAGSLCFPSGWTAQVSRWTFGQKFFTKLQKENQEAPYHFNLMIHFKLSYWQRAWSSNFNQYI